MKELLEELKKHFAAGEEAMKNLIDKLTSPTISN